MANQKPPTLKEINNALSAAFAKKDYAELNRFADLLKQLRQPATQTFSPGKS